MADKIRATFSTNKNQMGPKPIATCSHAFSRALRGLHVFASDSDWFVVLFAASVIGQND